MSNAFTKVKYYKIVPVKRKTTVGLQQGSRNCKIQNCLLGEVYFYACNTYILYSWLKYLGTKKKKNQITDTICLKKINFREYRRGNQNGQSRETGNNKNTKM